MSLNKGASAGIFALAVSVAIVSAARADAVLNLTPSTVNTIAGGMVEFDGTLTNAGSSDLYLNGDVVILEYTKLAVDDSLFFADSPLFLSPGSSYSGAFFDVTADADTLSGSYTGSYTVQGGLDSNAFDDIAVVDFTVDVDSNIVTPEPNPLLLLVSGLIILARMRLICEPLASR